ncbi:unnamed protein product [Ranitomeya imitator]|uniref:Secreted protein n=1 Tax=Ranitomeya imitator TaxID=111125 RepID=A0ABN9MA84_9NEOB|nr:unnamed protein product [Ranitomeya imitator]
MEMCPHRQLLLFLGIVWTNIPQDGNQGKHRVTKRGPALSYPMFTLVTGIVGRWRARQHIPQRFTV